ncbi:MAG: hypothetical protein AAF687_00395 [Pseudomonadota bacterium]
MPLKFNTRQAQQLTGIRREQLRHWRKVLPPLIGRDGRSDLYEFSEVIGLAVIESIVGQMGIAVSRLEACAQDIFAIIAEGLESSSLPPVLHLSDDGSVSVDAPTTGIAYCVINVPRVVEKVQDGLAPDARKQLRLPLLNV